jgi:leucyl aminopeptidase
MAKTQFLPNAIPCFLNQVFLTKTNKKSSKKGTAFLLAREDRQRLAKILKEHALDWQLNDLIDSKKESFHFQTSKGHFWVMMAKAVAKTTSHQGMLEESPYAWARESAGLVLSSAKNAGIKQLEIQLLNTTEDQELAVLVGLELSAYQFKNVIEGKGFEELPQVHVISDRLKPQKDLLQKAKALSVGVNWARHLVNCPPNALNPVSYAHSVQKLFSGQKNMSVQVWDEKRLLKENMGMHLAVGAASKNPPRLVHLRYRPKGKTTAKPIAFVGKGITFDSGGLDIKPSSGMRLMKKDMGGSASLVGLAYWICHSNYARPVDIYLALAENLIDARGFRPSDVLIARNGAKVEIHNTDAEGRLVLGDALDVAVTQKGQDDPEIVIDLATLTGAIKVGLGSEIAGLFSNHDPLADQLQKAGTERGELNWRMPLFSKYTAPMNSHFADYVNALDGFGGAITAALFLEKFVHQKPWAHLDIYAWNDKPTGSLSFAGGNGQCVQMLSHYLESVV